MFDGLIVEGLGRIKISAGLDQLLTELARPLLFECFGIGDGRFKTLLRLGQAVARIFDLARELDPGILRLVEIQ